jgi:hypothetical protein
MRRVLTHVALWSAVIATLPLYLTVSLNLLGLMQHPEGAGQAALFWLFIVSPVVLLALLLALFWRSDCTRTDRILTTAGAALYFGPWVLGLLAEAIRH